MKLTSGAPDMKSIDEIFPKGVMEKAVCYLVKPVDGHGTDMEYPDLNIAVQKSFGIYGEGKYEVIVYKYASRTKTSIKAFERARVHISLTIDLIPDEK